MIQTTKEIQPLKDKLTVLVCSCDAYEDLWDPFFTLLKKYWPSFDLHIIFNTESKSVSFDGLNIECVHSPSEKRYGKRMLNALSRVKTKYVLLMLDDFFLRKPVNHQTIDQVISWLDADDNIAYFNCESKATYTDYELDRFPGFKGIPPANDYTLNMQAAIWRTEILKGFWLPDVSPWEWETLCNVLCLREPRYKFYCADHPQNAFLDYGHYACGDIWGVYRGKWIIEDVGPLFEKENINVDFSIRGVCSKDYKNAPSNKNLTSILKRLKRFCQIRSFIELPLYIGFEINRVIRALLKHPTETNYITYLLEKERKRFMSSQR